MATRDITFESINNKTLGITDTMIKEVLVEGEKICSFNEFLPITYFASIMSRVKKNLAFQALLLYFIAHMALKFDTCGVCFSSSCSLMVQVS